MKRRLVSLVVCFSILLLPAAGMASGPSAVPDGMALVRLAMGDEGIAAAEATGVTLFARLGEEFLAGADAQQQQALEAAGAEVTVVDPVLEAGGYYLVYFVPGAGRPALESYGEVLLAERDVALLHMSPEAAAALAEARVEISAITLDAKPWRPHALAASWPEVVEPDPLIQLMIDQVSSTDVYSDTGDLSGEWPVDIGGSPYTIVTRHTYSGTPIQKATEYVGEWMEDLGLEVEYHQWAGATYPNVIGELPGLVNPDDIYIIGAHLDDMPTGPVAPGADDNASGSVATLLAAQILTQFEWGCTLRFALWTGEEQGLNGSHAYAQRSYYAGENILGYLNLDMIAWDSTGGPDIDLHANQSIPPSLDLAQLFADVVTAYDLNLIPEIIPNGTGASDHASFWDYGYTAILGIEDMDDFNFYYHTVNDRLVYLNIPYYTDFVKASVGTFAHMTGCLLPEGILSGTVTTEAGGAPLQGATVTAVGDGTVGQVATGPSGTYTMSLPGGSYEVSAGMTGYLTETVSGVVIEAGSTTVQNFALEPVPVIRVEPPALAATLEPGATVTHTLWITNEGAAELTFTLHELTVTAGLRAGGAASLIPEERSWTFAPEVAQDVWDAVAAGGQARVIISLSQQPDLSGAFAITGWAERGQYVYDTLQAHFERCGGELRSWLEGAGADPRALLAANAIAATVDEPVLRELTGRPEVARVGLDRPVPLTPTLAEGGLEEPQGVEWNIAKIRADEAWSSLGVTGEGITVGNIDTGVQYTHDALVSQYRGNLGGGTFDHNYNWFDFVNGQPEPYDDNDHGTFGVGIVVGDDGGGDQIGVAPGAKWIAVKACADFGNCPEAHLLAAMDWMLAPTDLGGGNPDPGRRPQIGLNTWGGGQCDPTYEMALMVWEAAGILPVFSPGGGGPSCESVSSPGDLVQAFTAGATDNNDVISSFSSRGPSCCGIEPIIKPETAAPGVNVRSSTSDGGYSVWSGTSLSAAHLAGTAALVLSADPTLDLNELENIIEQTAKHILDDQCGDPGPPNNVYGWGRIDAYEAVSAAIGLPWLSETPTAGTLMPGEGIPVAVRFDATELEIGTYTGLLDVESDDPAMPHVSVPVTLTVVPPCDPVTDVTLGWDPSMPTMGQVVTFTAEATGTEPISFEWDLGDGMVGAGAVVTHTYELSGTYTVVLTATNPCGQEIVVDQLTVYAEAELHQIYLPILLRN